MDEHEREAEIYNDNAFDTYSSGRSGSFDGLSSEEESDEEVCYATPSEQKKQKRSYQFLVDDLKRMQANLIKVYTSQAVRNAFWNASTATHAQAFNSAMKDLQRHCKGAFEKMNQLDPSVWSKAFLRRIP
ncbi:hypothetical protein ACET3Z_031290 [Daucus carota]